MPGTISVALVDAFPDADSSPGVWYGNADKAYASDEDYTRLRRAAVTPDFFATFGVAVDGRDCNARDDAANDPRPDPAKKNGPSHVERRSTGPGTTP